MASIGERLKKLRLERKLSTRKLAEKLGVTQSHISKVENSINKPSTRFIEKAAAYFEVDPSFFFINDQDLNEYTIEEQEILFDRKLTVQELKNKYDLVIDGEEATDEEIEEAIKYIKAIRIMNNRTS